jgi:hypothetical protein
MSFRFRRRFKMKPLIEPQTVRLTMPSGSSWRGWLWLPLGIVLVVALVEKARAIDAQNQVVEIPKSAWTGLEFHDSDEPRRGIYVNGLIDGFLGSPLFGGDEKSARAFHQCVVPMKMEQIVAIIAKHVDDHPERWHLSMHILAYNALFDACPQFAAVVKARFPRK